MRKNRKTSAIAGMVGALFLFLLVQVPAAAEKSRAGSDPAPGKIVKQKQTSSITPASEDQSPPASPWLQQVKEDIRKSEYHVTWQDKTYLLDIPAAWQAPNRARDLRTYFTPEGFHMIPRQSAAPEWRWGLAFKAYGFEGDLAEASPATLSAAENRIEYRRDGRLKNLLEWYLNDERGLEQGFTLSAPPSRSSSNSTVVVLRMEIQGNLRANSDASGQSIEFLTPGGVQVMRYGGLQARDAKGQELPAHLSLTGKTIHILVETAGAVYPITIDPLATSAAWTAESNQAGAQFGYSVGTAGDVNGDGYADVIVGANLYDNGQTDEGRAFVYHGSASGLSATPNWTAESNQDGAWFGTSVGTAGDVNGDGYADVIVGAYAYDNGQTDEGRAFVYHGSASGLSATPNWTAESDQGWANFYSVGTAGDVNGDGYSDVIIAAPFYNNDQTDEGRAYVYHGSASGLSATPNWTAESNQESAKFGYTCVGTAGDVNGDGYADVIVSAYHYDNGQTDEGRVFVYHGSASGLSATPNWTAESDQADAWFGISVGTAGDVNGDGYADVIVGANRYGNGQTEEGRAYVYHGSSSGLSTTPNWTAESDQANAHFGISVGTAGDVNGDGYSDVIIGAQDYGNGQTQEGRAYVYHGSASGLSATPNWTAESDQASAYFGASVGTAGDVNGDGYSDAIVGAYLYDNGQTDEGRAFVYLGSASGLAATAAWTAESDQAGAQFGISVRTAGDVNGDGYSDVIIGAPEYDGSKGRAFVYLGSASGLSATPNWTAESDQTGARLGYSVGTAGDVNGDGYADVIVGAYRYGNGQSEEGRAFVYHGSASGLSTTPNWTAESDQAEARFGNSVGTAGDVNGDGYADVIIGAPYYGNGQTNEGRAYVYHGSASGLSATPNWTAESDSAYAYFGFAVGTAGDVNGDGYADVIIGAYGQFAEGRAYVYHGSSSGLSATSNWSAGPSPGQLYGWSVGAAGDVDSDGYSDVVIGDPFYDNGQTDEGRAYVYRGSASGLSSTPNWTAESDQANAYFGISVGTSGDVNGDGYADVIVGAYAYDNGQTDEGSAFVYHGSASGLSATPNWTAESDQDGARFGWSVGTAGDVNGDGYADVIVGAYYYDNPQTDEGRAFVYYGNAGTGLSLIPQQRRYNNNAPIGPLGRSDKADSFRVAALGRTPYGRGKVKLEWEVKPLGTAFNGSNTQKSSSWTQIGTTGSQLNEIVSSLNASTSYHWRVRLLYHPATTPFQQHSRWLTPAWNGPQEAHFRTSSLATLVELVSFQLTSSAGFSLLAWQTAAETDSAGFHLWRRDNQSGEFRRITGALIPATGSPSSGASYTFEDRNLVQGRTYTYLLEEVDTAGTSTLYQQDTGIDPPLQGDVNSDGKLDLTDVLYILQVLSGDRH